MNRHTHRLFQYIQSKTRLDDSAMERIGACFSCKKLKRNEHLLIEGNVCRYNYFVNHGCLRFYSINEQGQELIRYFAFEGKFGTALSSFIEEQSATENIQAIEKTEVLAIARTDFYHLVDTMSAMNAIYRDVLEMAYVTSQQRIYDFQGQPALERLKWLLQYQPNALTRLPSKMVAAYLGVTPYTLSRLKAEL
ncbi:MAG: Crp/Fnr family transcriptional regulator [Saprospiraceae bacterium]|nr:Crp/Fnr family transcriptional regulator [Saprospiraceae bacterium]